MTCIRFSASRNHSSTFQASHSFQRSVRWSRAAVHCGMEDIASLSTDCRPGLWLIMRLNVTDRVLWELKDHQHG